MKEQVVSSRGVRRSASQTKGFVQRPARRDGSAASRSNFSPRALFAYVPKALKVVVGVFVLVTLIVGYRVAASASLFQVHSVDVTGTSRTSAEEIQAITRRAASRSGVWRADLTAISNELNHLPGVRLAVVTRVLPDGLRVRITERAPVAVVRTSAGHFVWVDDEGVMLGEMKPDDHMPAFFVRGWNEEGTDEARKENAERIQKYRELVREWDAQGLSERVSEVTLIDVRDVRAQLAGADSQIEVRLGSQDLGRRLKVALEALDMYKQSARGSAITYVDLQTGRVVIGFSSGNKTASDPAVSDDEEADKKVESTTTKPAPTATSAGKDATRKPKTDKPGANDAPKSTRKNDRSKENSVKPAALRFR
jgi:cell division protein FtsQ